jgi:hypothetical protein
MSEVQDIVMSADSAWIKIIDVNALLDVLAHAGIKKRCLDSVVGGQYSVVSKALIAKNLNVDVKDKLSKSLALSAAATSGQVAVSGGASASADVDQDIKTRMAMPVVLGVVFFPLSIFQQRPAVTEPVIYNPSGEMALTVTGNGGLGIIPQQSQTV